MREKANKWKGKGAKPVEMGFQMKVWEMEVSERRCSKKEKENKWERKEEKRGLKKGSEREKVRENKKWVEYNYLIEKEATGERDTKSTNPAA